MNFLALGTRIKNKRLEKNLTQEQLAEKVDLSAVYIGQIERGERKMTIQTLVKLANVLETSIEEFNPASVSSVSGLLRGDVDMAQYTEMGTCDGVPSDSVDIDYATGSLEEDIIDSGKNIVKVKKKQ